MDSYDDWERVKPRRKTHIELRDLTENDFLDLIASKNQNERFSAWLNFKPIFHDISEREIAIKEVQVEDGMQFFNDLLNCTFEEDDD